MKLLFFLSGEALKLAKAEIQEVFGIKKCFSSRRLGIINLKKNSSLKNFFSLAYTKKAYQFLFSCKISELEEHLEKFKWQSIYKKDFCLRLHYLGEEYDLEARNLAGYIWRSVKNPKVNLSNPKTLIEIFFQKQKAYCGLLIYEQKEPFEKRKAHKRPALHPISLHPKLARCLVNLSGAKKGDLILDPFCGTGGILIESSLIGIKSTGYDIDKNILGKCKTNLSYFKIKKCKLAHSDSTKITKKYDYVVTDLPYGKSTKKFEVEKLYLKFLKTLRKILRKKAVVVFPDNVNYKRLIKKAKLKILAEYDYYIHKSMSKRIVVIESGKRKYSLTTLE